MTTETQAMIGVDVGGTKVLAIVLVGGQVVDRVQVPTPIGGDEIVAAIAGAVDTLVGRLAPGVSVASVGAGIPGLVDAHGVLRVGPNIAGLVDFDFRTALAGRLGLAVTVDNDATCAAVAEARLGAAQGAADAVVVTLGTGIGGGIIANGQVVRGAAGFAGEPGHMVVDPNGPKCPCGQRGCWERYASGSGLGALAMDALQHAGEDESRAVLAIAAGAGSQVVRGEHVVAAAQGGDGFAIGILDEFADWVALGLANLVAILDPSVIVVGGGVIDAGDLLMVPLRRQCERRFLGAKHREPIAIHAAAMASDAGAIGAALLGADG